MIYNKSVINKNNYAGKSKNKRLNQEKLKLVLEEKLKLKEQQEFWGCSFGLAAG